jgi:hypothetical protein
MGRDVAVLMFLFRPFSFKFGLEGIAYDAAADWPKFRRTTRWSDGPPTVDSSCAICQPLTRILRISSKSRPPRPGHRLVASLLRYAEQQITMVIALTTDPRADDPPPSITGPGLKAQAVARSQCRLPIASTTTTTCYDSAGPPTMHQAACPPAVSLSAYVLRTDLGAPSPVAFCVVSSRWRAMFTHCPYARSAASVLFCPSRSRSLT